jgi:hypothetical protein
MELVVVVIVAYLAGMLGLYVKELERQTRVLRLHKRIVAAGTSVRKPLVERRSQTGPGHALIASGEIQQIEPPASVEGFLFWWVPWAAAGSGAHSSEAHPIRHALLCPVSERQSQAISPD